MAEQSSMRLQAETGDFIRVFEENLSKSPTQQQAYENTEKIHEELTGHRKYHDYSTFKVVRSRKFKKKS